LVSISQRYSRICVDSALCRIAQSRPEIFFIEFHVELYSAESAIKIFCNNSSLYRIAGSGGVEYLRKYEFIYDTSLAHKSGDPGVLFSEKNRGSKILWYCQRKTLLLLSPYSHGLLYLKYGLIFTKNLNISSQWLAMRLCMRPGCIAVAATNPLAI
jgi:hypothetical protein